MNHVKNLGRKPLPFALTSCVLGALFAAGCLGEGSTGITDAAGATDAVGGEPATAGTSANEPKGGSKGTSGSATGEEGGAPSDDNKGGTAQQPTEGGVGSGTGGAPPVVDGGAPTEEPQGGTGGASGEDDDDGVHIAKRCTFHTDPPAPEGAGGAPDAPAPNVISQLNAFVGSYLTDAAGRTLYTYGADLPGDCQTPPQSTCVADCLVSWPIFDAGARVVGTGLSDAAFGSIQRADGSAQTTYNGWPLYYYKADLTLGQLTGQGKGKTWHVAEVTLPSVVIMKAGTLKYLADRDGHTFYVSAGDVVGTADADPVSNCSGDCLDTFEPFHEKNYSVVTSLEPLDFSVFVRHGKGGQQLSYKGMPLYRAATDVKSGDMTGTAIAGFTAAVP